MTHTKALKLALEALELHLTHHEHGCVYLDPAITAIKEALAQPAQETNKNGSPCPEFWDWLPKAYNFEGDGNFTKYNMEVAFLAGKQALQPEQDGVAMADYMALVEKYVALKVAQPVQEPVARVSGVYGGRFTYDPINPAMILPIGMALYATPQHTATWVGLTDDEIKEIVGPYGDTPVKGYTRKLFDQIEAKLRSKNT